MRSSTIALSLPLDQETTTFSRIYPFSLTVLREMDANEFHPSHFDAAPAATA
tara:strand:+ start:299 stop:454 length:156 start_codon:yes stop_codon:yes gene_type:complete